MSKILVCGSRDYTDQEKVNNILDMVKPTSVVHSATTGVDGFAAAWCIENQVKQYPNHTILLANHPDLKLALAFGTDAEVEAIVIQAQSRNIRLMRIKKV